MLLRRLRSNKEWLVIAGLGLLAALIWCIALRGASAPLSITFLDVGNGDCIFIRTPSGRTVLVDGGGNPADPESQAVGLRVVEPFLRKEGVNKLDLLVLSHPHEDHVQGLVPVLEHFPVGLVLETETGPGDASYKRFRSLVAEKRIPCRRAARGQAIDFGDGARLTVLHPPTARLGGTGDDVNDNSIVLRLACAGRAVLLMGDSGLPAEYDILASGLEVSADVLKIAHHGSGLGTGDPWLDAVHPRVAVISLAKNNPFGHPSKRLLERLSARGIQVYRTDRHGAVIVNLERRGLSIRTTLPAENRSVGVQELVPPGVP